MNPIEAKYVAGAINSFPRLRQLIEETDDPVLKQAYRDRLANRLQHRQHRRAVERARGLRK